jgi:ACS family sodium-dependent inorganic phosphate cotransporter
MLAAPLRLHRVIFSVGACSAFFIGYTVTNLLGGYLASSIGAKQVLGWGVVLWSVFTITTPLAASSSLPVLLGNRAVMGAGEGVTFPCVQNVVKFWAPATVRSRALAFIYSGGQIGNIVALLTAPLIIKVSCWQTDHADLADHA